MTCADAPVKLAARMNAAPTSVIKLAFIVLASSKMKVASHLRCDHLSTKRHDDKSTSRQSQGRLRLRLIQYECHLTHSNIPALRFIFDVRQPDWHKEDAN